MLVFDGRAVCLPDASSTLAASTDLFVVIQFAPQSEEEVLND